MHVTSAHPPIPLRTASEEVALAVEATANSLMQRHCPYQFIYPSPAARYLTGLRRATIEGVVQAIALGRASRALKRRNFRQIARICTIEGIPLAEMADALDGAAEAVRDELLVPAAPFPGR